MKISRQIGLRQTQRRQRQRGWSVTCDDSKIDILCTYLHYDEYRDRNRFIRPRFLTSYAWTMSTYESSSPIFDRYLCYIMQRSVSTMYGYGISPPGDVHWSIHFGKERAEWGRAEKRGSGEALVRSGYRPYTSPLSRFIMILHHEGAGNPARHYDGPVLRIAPRRPADLSGAVMRQQTETSSTRCFMMWPRHDTCRDISNIPVLQH